MTPPIVARFVTGRPLAPYVTVGFLVLVLSLMYAPDLIRMGGYWYEKPEYSHGYLIPLISLFLLWQNKDRLQRIELKGSWMGVAVVVLGILFWLFAKLTGTFVESMYALLVLLAGVILSLWGWQALKRTWVPLIFLVFMIPLPPELYETLSLKLQLLSSELGVSLIRGLGISVLREGNLIDLGTYQLQVAEACNGIRYLFPLMSFGFLCAYLFRGKAWMRLAIFLSSIPIAIGMNGFRIAFVGVLVEHYGNEAAEGFLHYFEGWVIFLASLSLLLAEMWLLTKIGRLGRLWDTFVIDMPRRVNHRTTNATRRLPVPFLVSISLLLAPAIAVSAFSKEDLARLLPDEPLPARAEFAEFPMRLDEWRGKRSQMQDLALQILKPTDHLISDYVRGDHERVNLYAAYWEHLTRDARPHSPQVCLPASGWEISDVTPVQVHGVSLGDEPLIANRLTVEQGDHRELVYYWYQQGGRLLRSDRSVWRYAASQYASWEQIVRGRGDGAIVRLTTPINEAERWEDGDKRLTAFAQTLQPELKRFIPN